MFCPLNYEGFASSYRASRCGQSLRRILRAHGRGHPCLETRGTSIEPLQNRIQLGAGEYLLRVQAGHALVTLRCLHEFPYAVQDAEDDDHGERHDEECPIDARKEARGFRLV